MFLVVVPAISTASSVRVSATMSQAEDEAPILEKDEIKRRRLSRRLSSVESMHCPTCQGIGRIRRGIEHTDTPDRWITFTGSQSKTTNVPTGVMFNAVGNTTQRLVVSLTL